MISLNKIKIFVKILIINLVDIITGNVSKFAGYDKREIQFDYYIELMQEIKHNEMFENKVFNLSVASKEINKYVVLPGEIFSFWRIIGSPEKKFKKSRSIINGIVINEIGGGLCQVSGIIYHISILAGLKIISRHNHSVDIYNDNTRFTPLGTDATVVFGYKDLRIENNFNFPIKFEIEVANNNIIIKLLSASPIEKKNLNFNKRRLSAMQTLVSVSYDSGEKVNNSIYKNLPPVNNI